MMTKSAPLLFPSMRVGLFGGSFDPPHMGHVAISKSAQRQLRLDCVWWLVSPQNPLKKHAPKNQNKRIAAAKALVKAMAQDPHIFISDIETQLQTNHTIELIRFLQQHYPQVHFIWIMGADNLAQFHKWRGWQEILNRLPVIIYPRAMAGEKAFLSPAAQCFAAYRKATTPALVTAAPPAWGRLSGRLNPLSSTILRGG